ncbi:hypothetical protein CAPTEDRAFT_191820 [Capitella teleta]|uniref:Uncharacterized protein n=1 Tax=Capitella teleta TaxID=283909 RepID=R7U6K6_CAPTE|nr:hypothetical protein CAPTEDRAFT_191820 [Capitella teleta]|eukprot:ELT98775.1 hypothetical protein CAPTEDRAFT_191820 [Capitella teleta]
MDEILNDDFFKCTPSEVYFPDQFGLADLLATDNAEQLKAALRELSLDLSKLIIISGKQKRLILHDAAHKGACKVLSLLAKCGLDVNQGNPFHKQHAKPLWYAIKSGHRGAVRLLLELEADIKSLDDCKSPAVMVATKCYQPQVLLQLLGLGLDSQAEDMHGVFPLWQAAILGHDDIFKILLAKGADVNQMMVFRSPESPGLIQHSSCFEHTTVTWQGGSVLHALNSPEKLEMVQTAIRYGVNLNEGESSSSGKTPLHAAISKNNFEFVDILLDAGCDVNKSRPLMVALANNHYKLAARLICMGAEVNFTQINFTILGLEPHTPLTKACSSGEESLVNLLLESGANPNLEPDENEHDWAPIHYALHYPWRMRYHNTGVVKSLIKHGADVFQDLHNRNSQEIPIFLASYLGNQKAIALLIYEGCDIQLRDFLKFHIESPLEVAIKCHQEPTARVLLDVMTFFDQEHWLWSYLKHIRSQSDNHSQEHSQFDHTLPEGELELSNVEFSDFKPLEDGNFSNYVQINVTQPRSLKQISRHNIRIHLKSKILNESFSKIIGSPRMAELIDLLPLPKPLKMYARYESLLEEFDL